MILRIIGAITFISFISASLAAALLTALEHFSSGKSALIWLCALLVCEAILALGVFERRSPIFGAVFWKGSAGGKRVALTFDDGPNEPYTSQILDILKERRVRATFFVAGSNCRRFPGTIERLARDGHEIGNHTWTHEVFPLKPPSRIEEEIRKTSDIIEKLTGVRPALFRRPSWLEESVDERHFEKMRLRSGRLDAWRMGHGSTRRGGHRAQDPERSSGRLRHPVA